MNARAPSVERSAATAGVTRISAAGAHLAVHRAGAGPPVVCLHATGHSARDFTQFARRLGHRHEFVAMDWPGQGDSPREAQPASAGRYADLLAAAVDVLGLTRFILLGNSIGGAAAIRYAAANPQRVRGLVLCDAGGLMPANLIVRLYCRHMATRFERGARGDPAFAGWFERYYRAVLPAAAERRAEIVADGPQTAVTLCQAWTSFAQPDADIRHLVPKLAMPTFYAWARNDRALSWRSVRKAAMRAPRPEVKLFEGGHAPFLEAPEAFDASFLSFARALPA